MTRGGEPDETALIPRRVAPNRLVAPGARSGTVASDRGGSGTPRRWPRTASPTLRCLRPRLDPAPLLDVAGRRPLGTLTAARPRRLPRPRPAGRALRVTAVCSVIPRRPTVGVEPDTRSCKAGTWILGFTASPTARSVALTPAPARQLELKWRRPATMRSRCGPGPSRFRSFLAVVLIRASVTRRSRLVLVVQLGDDVVEPAPRTRRANRASAAARRPRNPASAQARSRRTRRRRWRSTQPDDHDASR